MLVPHARLLVPLGDLDPRDAAPLTDAALTPYHAIKRSLHKLAPGSTAVVIGVGGLGHMAVQILSAISPAQIVAIDTDRDKLALAADVGADVTLEAGEGAAEDVREVTSGLGAELVLDIVGSDQTMALAAQLVRTVRAHLTVVGIWPEGRCQFGFGALPFECQLTIPYWGSAVELMEVLDLARAGKIRAHVERFLLRRCRDAYDRIRGATPRPRGDLPARLRPDQGLPDPRKPAHHGGTGGEPGQDNRPGAALGEVVFTRQLSPRLLRNQPPEAELEANGEDQPCTADPRRLGAAGDRPTTIEAPEVAGEGNDGGEGRQLVGTALAEPLAKGDFAKSSVLRPGSTRSRIHGRHPRYGFRARTPRPPHPGRHLHLHLTPAPPSHSCRHRSRRYSPCRPRLLAGLSDDDPAGITTYSILGAKYGYELLWVLALSTAALIVFHELGVRLGIVTGKGLLTLVRERYGARRGARALRPGDRQHRHALRRVRRGRRGDGTARRHEPAHPACHSPPSASPPSSCGRTSATSSTSCSR